MFRAGHYILRMSGQTVSDFVPVTSTATLLCRCEGGGLLASLCAKKECYLLELSSAPAWLPFLTVLKGWPCAVRGELQSLEVRARFSPILPWVTLCLRLSGLLFSHLCRWRPALLPSKDWGAREAQPNTGNRQIPTGQQPPYSVLPKQGPV